jgi:hypothetical protein
VPKATPPDLSSPSYSRYRKKLADLFLDGDLAALRALVIPPNRPRRRHVALPGPRRHRP